LNSKITCKLDDHPSLNYFQSTI